MSESLIDAFLKEDSVFSSVILRFAEMECQTLQSRLYLPTWLGDGSA